jgi:excisionase family DNA binding protein
MVTIEQGSRLLTVREVAAELGVSPVTVYRWVTDGRVPAIRLGVGPRAPVRIDPDELAERVAEWSRERS